MKELYLCGRNSVIDAIKSNLQIKEIYTISKSHADKLKEFSNYKIVVKDAKFFDDFSNENHQGYIAVLKNFPIYDLDTIKRDCPQNILILDHIQDPHNLGAIIRTTNAAGIKHLIIPVDRAADITPTTLKISSGGFVGLKIIKVKSIVATIEKLKKWGFWIYASTLASNSVPYNKIEYNKPTCLIVGNEETGISKSVENAADQLIYIEQKGSVQSLNASVATGILLFELIKND
ncbi:23S rRNA (guanosine(2251)-2'-O)-methyltransferase RlmB [Mycoplasmopsis felifaucium]|uniref:23S rRNA (Guanosine(2251)-2'-O)-methyltransferase RlmB n=1 Tax=Mycoplasmopsis felifaucium TaxID=35768 RepID=A0ABZ2RXN7_9BACT